MVVASSRSADSGLGIPSAVVVCALPGEGCRAAATGRVLGAPPAGELLPSDGPGTQA
ncbi:MAG: hypothetical protein IT373_17060 [Polyangiaceae bacterium]|nr:hypothetical protein [Polyangiaceae bacterium]